MTKFDVKDREGNTHQVEADNFVAEHGEATFNKNMQAVAYFGQPISITPSDG